MSFAPLQLANGPVCPRCGCRESEILQHPTVDESGEEAGWFARMNGGGRARCGHCGNRFAFVELPDSIGPPPLVDQAMDEMEFEPADIQPIEPPPKPRDTAFPVRECPECGAAKTHVVSSGKKPAEGMPRIRYHKCGACGKNFKSTDSRGCN